MNQTTARLAAILAWGLFAATWALAHGDTIQIASDGLKMRTGLENAITGEVTPARVFGGDFDWTGSQYATEVPGFTWSTAFTSGDQWRADVIGRLWKWTGNELVESNQTVRFNSQWGGWSSAAGLVESPTLTVPIADHMHIDYSLEGLDEGQGQGVYVVALQMHDLSHGLQASQPFFIVFNQGESDTVHDEVIDRAVDTLSDLVVLRGRVELKGYTGEANRRPVTVELREPGTTTALETITTVLAPDGEFALLTRLQGSYDIAIKGQTHLRRVKPGIVLGEDGAWAGQVSLVNGDIDGDNAVTVFDYSVLSDSFDLTSESANWNVENGSGIAPERADLDGDGAITVFDYSILSNHFDQVGQD